MAVTQQLARLSVDDLARCRVSVEVLHLLYSFELRPDDDYVDLDWSPRPLELLAARVDARLSEAIAQVCSGAGAEINPAYRDHPLTIFDHPVLALEPDAVREVAAVMARWPPDQLLAALPYDRRAALTLIAIRLSEFSGHPHDYLHGHYESLRRFCAEAAAAGMAVVSWGD